MSLIHWYKHYQEAVHTFWLKSELEAWKSETAAKAPGKSDGESSTSWMARTGLHLLALFAASSLSGFLQLLPFLGGSAVVSFLLAILSAGMAWQGVFANKWKAKGGVDEGLLTASLLFFAQGLFQTIGSQHFTTPSTWLLMLALLTCGSYFTGQKIHSALLAFGWLGWFWWKNPAFTVAVPTLLTACFLLTILVERIKNWPHPGKAFWLEGWQQASALAGPFLAIVGFILNPTYAFLWPIALLIPISWIILAWVQRSLERMVYALAGLIAGFSWMNGEFSWMAWDLWSMLIAGIALVGLLALLFRLKRGPWAWLSEKEEVHPEMNMVWSLWMANQHQLENQEQALEQGGATGGGGASADY